MINFLAMLLALQVRPGPHPVVVLPSTDGKTVSRMGEDEAVRTWDAATGKLLHVSNAWAVQTSKSRYVVRELSRYTPEYKWYTDLILTRADTGAFVRSLKGLDHNLTSLVLSPDNSQLIFGDASNRAQFWNLDAGNCRTFPNEAGRIIGITMSQDGRQVALHIHKPMHDSVILRSYPSGKLLRIVNIGNFSEYSSTFFSPDLEWFFGENADGLCQLSTNDGKLVRMIKLAGQRSYTIWAAPNKNFIVTRGSGIVYGEWIVEIWSMNPNSTKPVASTLSKLTDGWFLPEFVSIPNALKSEALFWKLAGYQPGILPETSATAEIADHLNSPHNVKRLMVSLTGGLLGAVDIINWSKLRLLKFDFEAPYDLLDYPAKSVSPGVSYIIEPCVETVSVRNWDDASETLRWKPHSQPPWMTARTVSANRSLIAVAYALGPGNFTGLPQTMVPLRVYDARTGKELWQMPPLKYLLGTHCHFTPNGDRLITYGIDQEIIVWNAITGQKLQAFDPKSNRVEGLAVNNRTVVANIHDEVGAWSIETGLEKWRVKLPDNELQWPVMSVDGSRLMMRDRAYLIAFSCADGKRVEATWMDYYRSVGTRTIFEGRPCIGLIERYLLGWRTDQWVVSERQPCWVKPTITLLDESTGRLMAEAYVFRTKKAATKYDWLVLRNDGRYSGSPGIERYLRRPVGNRMLPIEHNSCK